MGSSPPPGVLLDRTRDKVVLLDETGTLTYANAAAERILGFEPGDYVGTNAFDYIHDDDKPEVRRAFEETVSSEDYSEVAIEYRHRTASGEWVWLESAMSNLTDENLDGYVVTSRDVTDRVAAERERKASATRLREITAASSDVLWLFDGDWSELLFLNPAYEEIYGGPVGAVEADPSTFLDAIHPEDVPAVKDAMERLSAGTPVDMEYRVNPGEDYDRWVWGQATPIVEDGEVVRIAGFSRDVTDRRRRERQLYVMDNLLRHNLRNDMTVILGAADSIQDEHPDAADRTAVIRRTGEDLLASAEKQREIIDVLTKQHSPEPMDAVELVERAVATVRSEYPDAAVTLSSADAVPVSAIDELHVAVVELIENAVEYAASDRPTVAVGIEKRGDRVAITVEDRAGAIPDIEAAVLRGDHDMTEVYHSTGLGLWLVYWCVELSDGDVEVEPRPDGGNLITVLLPTA